GKPELTSQQERATAFAGVARRLDEFWVKGFPEAVAPLKGKPITAGGETGVLTDVGNGKLELEKPVAGGSAGVTIAFAKLTPGETAKLVAASMPNDKETLHALAWFFFAEKEQAQASAKLGDAEKAGADVAASRELMALFA